MLLKSFFAALASISFSIIFNVRGRSILLSGLCGGLGYFCYLLIGPGNYSALFYAGMVITFAAELIARATKTPATLFLVGGLLPLVPGGEMFKMFLALIEGKQTLAMSRFANTLLQAGALAIGTVIVSSIIHFALILSGANKKV